MTAHQPSKRQWIKGAAATVGTLAVAPQLWAQTGSAAPIRNGYAIARTGHADPQPCRARRRSCPHEARPRTCVPRAAPRVHAGQHSTGPMK